MKKIVSLALVAVFSFSLTACSPTQKLAEMQSAQGEMQSEESVENALKYMSGEDLIALLSDEKALENTILVDVRTKEEFSAGHIKGAINIPIDEFSADLGNVQDYKEKMIVLYCRSGNRSGQVGEFLVQNGFKNVYSADGVSQFSYDLVTE